MKLYVSATLYYGYEIEVSDEQFKELTEGYDKTLVDYAVENDPIKVEGIDTGASCEWFVNSIFDEQGEEYYVG